MMPVNRRNLIAGGAALAMLPRFASAAPNGSSSGGFMPDGLKRITSSLKSFVEKEEAVGLVGLLYRKGEVAQVDALGWRDREAKSPMARDSIFRIASMTKPTVAVATLMLMEEGKFRLTDPIAKWVPELANVKVLRTPGGPLEDTVAAARQITVVDLLTHRSGLGYDFTTTGALAAKLKALDDHGIPTTTDAWMKDLGALPLVTDVGVQFQYGLSFDVLGVLIERVSGVPFQEFMRTRVFGPLGMVDTAFHVPKEKVDRLAALYSFTADGKRAPKVKKVWTEPPPFASGGGGLYSTADDYLKFAKLLLGKGKSGDVRLVSGKSVELMTANWLTPEQRKIPFSGLDFWAGQGFGLGVAVVDDIARYSAMGTASKGTFYWPGLYGTWWMADPAEDMIMIYLVQNDPGARGLGAWLALQSGAYRAIDT